MMFSQKEKYNVKLDLFEGPLDLLLFLIKKNEMDIYNIPMELITEQYLEYLSLLKELSLDNVGEFILLASQLIYIKSQMLLPESERGETEELEDPRLELVQKLLEYRKFKNAAINLDKLQDEEADRYPRFAQIVLDDVEDSETKKLDVNIFELLEAFSEILKKRTLDASLEVGHETITVADKITELMERLKNEIQLSFYDFLETTRTRMELICSFLAVLELIKQGEIIACQNESFGDIILKKILS